MNGFQNYFLGFKDVRALQDLKTQMACMIHKDYMPFLVKDIYLFGLKNILNFLNNLGYFMKTTLNKFVSILDVGSNNF